MIKTTRSLWLLPCLMASVMLAADPVAPVPTAGQADTSPILADRLGVRAANGDSIPFADLLGPDGRAVCFAFLHPACPLAQEYGPVLGELAAQYADKGIRFVGVVCESDDAAEIEDYRKTYSIPFPIYTDTDFRLAEALDATITPEVVLVDRDRSIRYAGRINDRYKVRRDVARRSARRSAGGDPRSRRRPCDQCASHPGRGLSTRSTGAAGTVR